MVASANSDGINLGSGDFPEKACDTALRTEPCQSDHGGVESCQMRSLENRLKSSRRIPDRHSQ